MWLTDSRRLWLAFMVVAVLIGGVAAPASAGGSHKRHPGPPRVAGMIIVESNRSFDDTWTTLIEALDANENIRRGPTVDHQAAANGAGLELGPNRVVFFGNPRLGTPLMQTNQTVGLDLPQKIQVFEWKGRVWVGFNDAPYLGVRHRLGEQPTLDTIAGALRNLAGTAADTEIDQDPRWLRSIHRRPGLITRQSDADVDTTWDRLLAAIERSPANIAFEVDHQANAGSVDLELRPTRLVVFGNPNLGTPLMQAKPTAGIDLPIKFLVWEDEHGRTQVTTNDPRFIRHRHRAWRVDFSPIATAVDNFLNVATTTPM